MRATTPFTAPFGPAAPGWPAPSARPAAGHGVAWFTAVPAHGPVLSAQVSPAGGDAPKDADGWARRLLAHLVDEPGVPASR